MDGQWTQISAAAMVHHAKIINADAVQECVD
jgi:hypothetical protein